MLTDEEIATQEDSATLAAHVAAIRERVGSLWNVIEDRLDGTMYGLRNVPRSFACFSVSLERDGRWWLHLSVSRADERLPTWEELLYVRDILAGPEATAYQILPPRSQHVNVHDFCLHLWVCLDGPVTPDFTRGGKGL